MKMSKDIRCIAILSAMSSELQPTTRALGLSRSPENSSCNYQGTYLNVKILAVITNMGLTAAEKKTNALFSEYGDSIDHVFVLGIAGSNDAGHRVGQVVPIDSVIDERDGITRHTVSLSRRTPVAKLISTDALIYDDECSALMLQCGASLVDMESGAIVAICARHKCPVTIIRAVSDKVSDGHLDGAIYQLANGDGSPKYWQAMRYALRKPSRIRGMVALALGTHKAIRSSSAELRRSINTLLSE